MPPGAWFQPPRHLLVSFLVFALAPVAALGWLGWRLLEQERALERQRAHESLQSAADRIGATLGRQLTEIEGRLSSLVVTPGPQVGSAASELASHLGDALIVVLSPGGIDGYPPGRLLYYPFLLAAPEPPADTFAQAAALEFRRRDPAGAAAAYRKLTGSPEPAVRAAALLGVARTLRKARDLTGALAAYDDLARLGAVPVSGLPADLLARQERCALLAEVEPAARLASGGRVPLLRSAGRSLATEARGLSVLRAGGTREARVGRRCRGPGRSRPRAAGPGGRSGIPVGGVAGARARRRHPGRASGPARRRPFRPSSLAERAGAHGRAGGRTPLPGERVAVVGRAGRRATAGELLPDRCRGPSRGGPAGRRGKGSGRAHAGRHGTPVDPSGGRSEPGADTRGAPRPLAAPPAGFRGDGHGGARRGVLHAAGDEPRARGRPAEVRLRGRRLPRVPHAADGAVPAGGDLRPRPCRGRGPAAAVLRPAAEGNPPAASAGRRSAGLRAHGGRRPRVSVRAPGCGTLVRDTVADFQEEVARQGYRIELSATRPACGSGATRRPSGGRSGTCWTTPSSTRRSASRSGSTCPGTGASCTCACGTTASASPTRSEGRSSGSSCAARAPGRPG